MEKSKKEELLEEVKRRYPIGTIFYPAHLGPGDETVECGVYDYNDITIDSDEIRLYLSDYRNLRTWMGTVYSKAYGGWATIKSLPESIVNEQYEIC